MNIFESTFEKHKKLVLEARKDPSPEFQQMSKEASARFAKMSPQEIRDYIETQKKFIEDEGKKEKTQRDEKKMKNAKFLADLAASVSKTKLKGDKSDIAPEEKNQIQTTLGNLMDKDYPGFVQGLKAVISDPKVQKFLLMAKRDTTLKDDKVNIDENAVRDVSVLQPTQSEVFFENSIEKPLIRGMFDQIKNYIIKGEDGGMPHIVVTGNVLIDGHHRWSQAFCWNKHAKMKAYDITFPGGDNSPDGVLKRVQLGIAASVGDVPQGEVKGGKNLFAMDENTFKANIIETFKKYPKIIEVFKDPAVLAKMKENNSRLSSQEELDKAQQVNEQPEAQVQPAQAAPAPAAPQSDDEYISTVIHPYMWSNVQVLSAKSGKYPRSIMPQTGENEPAKKYIQNMKSGNVNFDVKTENIFESTFKKFKDLYTK